MRCWLVDAKPSPKQKQIYQLVHDSLQNSIKACRNGATTADAAKCMLEDKVSGVKEEGEGSHRTVERGTRSGTKFSRNSLDYEDIFTRVSGDDKTEHVFRN